MDRITLHIAPCFVAFFALSATALAATASPAAAGAVSQVPVISLQRGAQGLDDRLAEVLLEEAAERGLNLVEPSARLKKVLKKRRCAATNTRCIQRVMKRSHVQQLVTISVFEDEESGDSRVVLESHELNQGITLRREVTVHGRAWAAARGFRPSARAFLSARPSALATIAP